MDMLDDALDFLLDARTEGGFSNRSRADDPGGPTNFGITQATLSAWRGHAASTDDVRRLGRAEAKAIYRAWYWDKCRCGELPWPLALATFNAAVMSGPARAVLWLQTALGVAADGRIGPATIAAAHRAAGADPIARLLQEQQHYNENLGNYGTNKNGWTRRLFRLAFVAGATVPPAAPEAA